MWIVFEVISIGEMKPISNALETVEDAISFRQTMLEGTLYKNSNLVYSYIGKVLDSFSECLHPTNRVQLAEQRALFLEELMIEINTSTSIDKIKEISGFAIKSNKFSA